MMTIDEKIARAKADYDEVFEAGKKSVLSVLDFSDIESNTYRVTVPSGADDFARVNKIGGMTYKVDNELRSASVSELKSEGANIANITYDKSSWIFNSGNGTVISTTENSIVGEGVKGSSPYAPYASNGWLTQRESTAKITQFKRGERISLSYDFEILELPTDYNGSTITIGCGFGFIGNYSASLWKQININFALGIQKVSVTFDVTDVEANLTPLIRIAFSSLHAKVSNIMINYGDVTSYKPYREGGIDTLPIPEAIKSIDGYGLGVNSEYYNYIDFERKVFVQNVYRKVLDGTEYWQAATAVSSSQDGRYRIRYTIQDDKVGLDLGVSVKSPIVCNLYNTASPEDTYKYVKDTCSINNGTLVHFYDEAYNTSDISLWKAHLAELYASGNPLMIDYALANPIETDISAYLTDEYIEVEGGGTITAVNEYGYDAPTNISYLIDTQGG